MKRAFIIFSVFTGVLLSGCGQDQYALEKQYYSALKKAEKIFKNPHASPPNELQTAVESLSRFSGKAPKTGIALNAEFNIARLYLAKEEYGKARAQLAKIMNTYKDLKPVCAEAVFLTGNSYELQDKWNLALEQYKKIMREYSNTSRGLGIPIYIFQHYKAKFQPDMMMEAARQAVSYYNSLAENNPNTVLSYQSKLLAAECYIALKEWNNAIVIYNNLMEAYKDKIPMDGVLLKTAMIYKNQLNDNAKAKDNLEKLVREYPKSRFANFAKNLLKKE